MKVLVSGATGLIGSALLPALEASGHEAVRLIRPASTAGGDAVRWDPARDEIDTAALEGVEGVIHLAGEGIADRRWSGARKQRILRSRVDGTTLLATALSELAQPPAVLVSGSAIGVYGDRGDERLVESSPPGDDFLSNVCQQWEAATSPAEAAGIRVAHARTGIVLSRDGGALAEQLPFFRLGLGGRMASGRQWMSWISIDDHVAALLWLLEHNVAGPVNLTAPNPMTNREFTKALGTVLRRPTAVPIPKPILWARLGRELTEALLCVSQRVEPGVLSEQGFEFAHPDIETALRAVLERPA